MALKALGPISVFIGGQFLCHTDRIDSIETVEVYSESLNENVKIGERVRPFMVSVPEGKK